MIHKKGIIHSNIKPSKVVIGREGEEDRIYLIGFENCEKINPNRSKSTTKAKKYRDSENVYSPLSVHMRECIVDFLLNNIASGFRDDLESLGYIIVNYFFGGKLFEKISQKISDENRNALVKLKTNLLSEMLLSGIPGSVLDWIKIPNNESNKYRSKMLSYFFCAKYTPSKKPSTIHSLSQHNRNE
jgi:serine/threonine protein kinase